MATPTWIKQILAGGLPAVLDYGDQAPQASDTADPERSPPTDITGREPINPGENFLRAVTSQQAMTFAAVAVAVIAVVAIVKKL